MATLETQALVIDTALMLFNKYGCAQISTNRIATECGISRGNLYYHFNRKEEIILSIFQRIARAMHEDWPEEYFVPTLENMAGMYVRQSRLILEFEFFYREMPALLRQDPLLRRRYREHQDRRINAITKFFKELADCGMMDFGPDPTLIRSLVIATWIIADNWPNFVEFQGEELDVDAICQGYNMILHVLGPYFKVDFDALIQTSHQTIRDMVAQMKDKHRVYSS